MHALDTQEWFLEKESEKLIAELLDLIPKNRQIAIVEALEVLANLLSPENAAFQNLLKGCRCGILPKETKHEVHD